MYTEAFESDTNMQRWDSGCWIRYKLFEKVVDNMPTVPYSPRWHKVEEELPEIGKLVLVSYGGDVQILKRTVSITYGGRNYWWNEADGLWERVEEGSYWMPIEPPKEDA